METVQSRRVKKPYSVNRIESIEITYQDGRTMSYRLLRGALTWPIETHPGTILLGGQPLDSDEVIIFEVNQFRHISEALGIFEELWRYLPTCYYFNEDQEGEAFLSFLRRTSRLNGKVPLVPAVHAKAKSYGDELIKNFLEEDRLTIPSGSVLEKQLKETRWDTPEEEISSVVALRYLLCGVTQNPWETEITYLDLSQCFV